MCARLYLNGHGAGERTHVSLFFVIMRGAHDALLRWPFGQRVTLMLLDQREGDQDRRPSLFVIKPDPTSASFQRPDTPMNVAVGCPRFLPLEDVFSEESVFVKDDTAFVKIVVSLDSLSGD